MSALADCGPDALARVVLSFATEPGDAAFGSWVDEVGAEEALSALLEGACRLRAAEAYRSRVAAVDLDDTLALADAVGAGLLVPGTAGWPTQLDDLGVTRPLVLWVRGAVELRRSALCSVAVVGARAATSYGESIAAELAAGLAERRWTVVSGGAYGVDAAAHRGTLAVEGVTVAVLANGIDQMYPAGNSAVLARIADTGVIVTELPPGARPTRSRFLERNRVIAALSRGTVVVEAAQRSGALGTAARAAALHRCVMGVPGPVTSAASAGVHTLLRDRAAVLVRGVDDVLELVAPLGALASSDPLGRVDGTEHPLLINGVEAADSRSPNEPDRQTDGRDARTTAVALALRPRRAVPAAELARAAGIGEHEVLAVLGDLAGRGLAERVPGGWRRAPRTRPG